MNYILTQQELDALTPIKRLQERNEALEQSRKLILESSGHMCHHDMTDKQWEEPGVFTDLCDDCPIGKLKDRTVRNHICILSKDYSK